MTDHMREFAFLTPDERGHGAYLAICEGSGLTPTPDGYGLVFVEDDDGFRWTRITTDVSYLRDWLKSGQRVMRQTTNDRQWTRKPPELAADKFTLRRAGWPDQWNRSN